MTNKWLVVHIGCIECGVSSGVVGLFSTMEAADKIAEQCNDKHNWMGGGQNSFEVFELPEENVVHEDYEGIEQ